MWALEATWEGFSRKTKVKLNHNSRRKCFSHAKPTAVICASPLNLNPIPGSEDTLAAGLISGQLMWNWCAL